MTIVDRTRSGVRSGIGRPGVDTHTHPATAVPGAPTAPTAPTGAGIWREGDPAGDRRFARIGDVALERGGRLPAVRVAYESWGPLNAAGDNAVLVEHALTGDSHVVGARRSGPPLAGVVGRAHRPGPPARHRPVVRRRVQRPRRVPGHDGAGGPRPRRGRPGAAGSPSSPSVTRWPSRRGSPTRSASLLGRRRRGLDGRDARARVGRDPPRSGARAVVLASTAYATADQIAWAQPQLLAIRSDPAFRGRRLLRRERDRARRQGLGIARRIAHVTYRSGSELDERFGRAARSSGRTRWGPAAGTRWRATSTTMPRSSPAASTPTPTSCSPRR